MSVENLQNPIIEGVQIIVDSAIAKTKNDKTIIAKIIQIEEKDNNYIYLLDTGSFKFNITTPDKYSKGNQVRVLLPEGDYGSDNRQIIGKVITSTLSDEDKVSSNMFSDLLKVIKFEIEENMTEVETNFNYNANYDYIGIVLKFNDIEDIPDTFNIDFYFNNDDIPFISFTEKDIVGNINMINSYLPQKLLLDLSSKEDIVNHLTDITKIHYNDNDDLLQSCSMYFGYSKKKIGDQYLKLYTNTLNYSDNNLNTDVYIEYYNGGEKFYSCYRKDGEVDSDFDVGYIDYFAVPLKYSIGYSPTEDVEELYWKAMDSTDMYVFTTDNNLEATSSKYKVKIFEEENSEISIITSDTLTLTNLNTDNIITTNSLEQPIRLTLDDGDNGIYDFYGIDGKPYDQTKITKERKIIASIPEIEQSELESDNYSIEWNYPLINTGIVPKYLTYGDMGVTPPEDKQSYDTYIDENGNKVLKGEKFEFCYNLSQYYYSNWTNNTISCTIINNITNEKFYGDIILQFGGGNNSGTEYVLKVDFLGNQKYLLHNCGPSSDGIVPPTPVALKASFERLDGEPLDVEPEYRWTWYEIPSNQAFCRYYYKNDNDEYTQLYTIEEKDGNRYLRDSYINKTTVDDTEIYDYYTEDTIYISTYDSGAWWSNYWNEYNTIVEVKVKYETINNGTVTFKEYLSIPILPYGQQVEDKIRSIEGPVRIVYDMNNEQYFIKNTPYSLYDNEDKIEGLSWKLSCLGGVYDIPYEGKSWPTHYLKETNRGTYLQVIDGILLPEKPLVTCIIPYKNEDIKFLYPILTIRNSWNYNNINEWTGQQTTMSDQFILSPFVAAGAKNEKNKFTGTMLGSANNKFGLYGYQEGLLRYKLDEDGNFFVGNNETNNYIEFINTSNSSLNIRTTNFDLNSTDLRLSNNEGIVAKKGYIAGWDITSDSGFKKEEYYNIQVFKEYNTNGEPIYETKNEKITTLLSAPTKIAQSGTGSNLFSLSISNASSWKDNPFLLRSNGWAWFQGGMEVGNWLIGDYRNPVLACNYNEGNQSNLNQELVISVNSNTYKIPYYSGLYEHGTIKFIKKNFIAEKEYYSPITYWCSIEGLIKAGRDYTDFRAWLYQNYLSFGYDFDDSKFTLWAKRVEERLVSLGQPY